MAEQRIPNVTIEGARIVFRNFAGAEGQYNRAGDRNFAVLLEPSIAEEMAKDGWNIKTLRAREEEDEPQPYVQVSVSYKGRPPNIVMVSSKGRTSLPEDMVEILDYVDIANVDLILNPYQWAVSGKTGVKAYLKTMFVTILEDELQQKYADVPEIDFGGRPLAIEAGQDPNIVDAELVHD